MILTPSQIQELMSIVDKHRLTFIARRIGTHVLTKEDLKRLRSFGVNTKGIPEALTVQQAYKFGMLSDALNEAQAKNLSYAQVKESLMSNKFMPLNQNQRNTLIGLEMQAAKDITTLSDRMRDRIATTLYAVNDEVLLHNKVVTSAAEKALRERKGLQSVASDIAQATGGWGRDFQRMSDYVMHAAFNKGRAAQMEKEGHDQVYFDVYPGACKHCIRVYLTGGIGSEPRIFTVAQLEANGSNVGRKAKDWKATLYGVHPWCRCTLRRLMKGMKWDPVRGEFRFAPIAPGERKVQRPPVELIVNGKRTTI